MSVVPRDARLESPSSFTPGVELEHLQFINSFLSELPGDAILVNTPRQVYSAAYSFVEPAPTNGTPRLIACSTATLALLGLDPGQCGRQQFAAIFSGNSPWPNSHARPYAHCYGGWQFGEWAGQLGDGRAISLGHVAGRNGIAWEVQQKGAGPTPYSRGGDGRAVLLSSLREHVASEAMAALGIPTTQALALVLTGGSVHRDMLYSGDLRPHPGAVTTRVSHGFLRFGTLQLPAARGGDQLGLVKELTDYVIRHHYPRLAGATAQQQQYALWLQEVGNKTAALIAEWHRVGFVHGVLNTDNLSLLGETLDYGPFGFLERFDPDYIPNTSDLPEGRYRFRNQPGIGAFNLEKLGEALVVGGLVTQEEVLIALAAYQATFVTAYRAAMARKLGMRELSQDILRQLLQLMYEDGADYTNTFRSLASACLDTPAQPALRKLPLPPGLAPALGPLSEARTIAWKGWQGRYCDHLATEGLPIIERVAIQDAANPFIVPRNHVLAGLASRVEAGELGPLHRYLEALERPYMVQEVEHSWIQPGPRQLREGIDQLSCAS
ncbi:hypothetical protein N2152v2_003979 [Parachlorella kessleri]